MADTKHTYGNEHRWVAAEEACCEELTPVQHIGRALSEIFVRCSEVPVFEFSNPPRPLDFDFFVRSNPPAPDLPERQWHSWVQPPKKGGK